MFWIFFSKNQNNLAFHLGPVQPPGGEGSPLEEIPGRHMFGAVAVKTKIKAEDFAYSLSNFDWEQKTRTARINFQL